MSVETDLFGQPTRVYHRPRGGSMLKWIGNKYKMAEEICSHFPTDFGKLYDVFVGGASILATVAPTRGVGSDTFGPLIEIWMALKTDPEALKSWYADRWHQAMAGDPKAEYERIKASYNSHPNGADFLYLTRACYGGVVRFRKADGFMSTPCGPHRPIAPDSFAKRVNEWSRRLSGCKFIRADYRETMSKARQGDLVYCDPPYSHSQSILYGAQDFQLADLFDAIASCKQRGVFVALSIDGTKRSGEFDCELPIPHGLFEREERIQVGRSMLKRFQMNGRTLEDHEVTDRLLLTY